MKKALIIVATILAVSLTTPSYTSGVPSIVYADTESVATFPDIQGHWAQKEIEYIVKKYNKFR